MNIMRVLENNNKPATHFIEVYKRYNGVYEATDIIEIKHLKNSIIDTSIIMATTIAIFKIRMNTQ